MPSLRNCLELAGVFGKSAHAQSIVDRARTYVHEDGYEAAYAERLAVQDHLDQLDRQLDGVYKQAGVERPEPSAESQTRPSTLAPRPSTVKVTADHLAQARAALDAERPPDVLDDIFDGVTKKGVSFSADHKDTIGKAKGQAREMIRQRDGEPANQVLQALADQNPKYADWTEGDLAEAMINAGETRMRSSAKDRKAVQQAAEEIARAEQENTKTQTPNTKENDPWAETIDKLNTLKVDTNGQLHAFGLLPEAWNTLIEMAKTAVRGGKAFAEAIDWAIAEFKARFPDQPFDEAGARTKLLNDGPERATGQKIAASSAISPQVKLGIEEYLYETRTNAGDQATADGLVAKFGVDAATELWRTPPADMPGAVQSKLLGSIVKNLAEQERQARMAGAAPEAEALINRQVALWDEALPRITDAAQELQALTDLVAMSPDAQVARTKRQIEKAGTKHIDEQRGQTDQMRTALEDGRAAGIEELKQDPAANTAARAAVEESIKDSPETHRAIVMELAEPWAKSDVILNHAREQVRAKANELLNNSPRPPGFTPAQHLRQILDDLAARAAGIFAGHIQGSEPGLSIVDKLSQRLGLDKAHAQKLASSLSKEWDAQLAKARKQLDTRLAAARARQELRAREPETNAAVDRALRKQLRAQNLKLGDAIRQTAGDRTRNGEHLADAIVEASGLTGEKADALRAALTQRYNELVAEAQRRALAAIEARSGVKTKPKLKTAFDKLVEIDRLAPGNGNEFIKTVRAALKLPTLTDLQARELRKLVQDAQAKPPGWQQQRAMARVLTYTEHAKGKLGWKDVPMAIWYANIFSSPLSHTANLIGNSFKALEVVGIETMLHPTAAPQILRAFARGAETGTLEAANVMRTGQLEGTRLLKGEPARPLEWRVSKGGWNKVFLPWAAVGRALAAEDVLFFKGHEEVKWQILARKVAQREGLAGEALAQRVQELLHDTRGEYEAAKVTAAKEGLTDPVDVRRRAHEIIEQARETSLPGSTASAREYGLTHTFNSEPYGVLGALAQVLNNANQKLVVTRFAMPVVRIVANLGNESLNYFPPVGVARLLIAAKTGKLDGRAIGASNEFQYHFARAAVGTVLFGALAALGAKNLAEDDPLITGQGPRTKAQREQLRSTGWKANAIKIGDHYVSYQETQLALPLSILGNYYDAMRYKDLDQEDALNRTAYAFQNVYRTILDQRMLSGIGDLMDVLHSESTSAKPLGNFAARIGAGFVVPNAVRFVDQVFDPQKYEANDIKGMLYLQIPVARETQRPAINALGEPVTRPALERFASPIGPDALVRTLARKNAWLPMPVLEEQTVGNRKFGPDYLRPMTSGEYYTWIAESGPAIRAKLTDNLDRLAGMTDEQAQAYVRKVTADEREKVRPKN